MSERRAPPLVLKLLCLRTVREHFCALSARAAAVLPCGLLEELQLHLTVCQLDQLQPALNLRGVSTLSGWRELLRDIRGPSSALAVCDEDEARLLVMKCLFSSVLYDCESDVVCRHVSRGDRLRFLLSAAPCISHFLLLNMEEALRKLTQEHRGVLEILEKNITSVCVSRSLDPDKVENHLALLVLHRLLDHGRARRVVIQARCPLTLAWLLHTTTPHTSALCWGPRSSRDRDEDQGGDLDQGSACKRPRLQYREARIGIYKEEPPGDRAGDRAGNTAGNRAGDRPEWVGVSPGACHHAHIESLELRQCQEECMKVLVRALPSCGSLSSLTVYGCSLLSESLLVDLVGALEEQSRGPGGGLTQLCISSLLCFSVLEPLLDACPRLLSLTVDVHNMQGPSGARPLSSSQNCRQFLLETLSVSLNQQPSECSRLQSLLQHCPHLCSLHVTGLRLQSAASYAALLTTLSELCGSLKRLSLGDVNLSQCLEPVLLLLSCCRLQELSLNDCRLLEKCTDKQQTLQRLTSALSAHSSLQSLSLAHNRIARHVPVLAELFSERHSVLQRLDLSSNFIQPEELLKFSQRLWALRPGLRITLDLRKNPLDRDPHTRSRAIRSLSRSCSRLLLETWTSTDTMVDHISNM